MGILSTPRCTADKRLSHKPPRAVSPTPKSPLHGIPPAPDHLFQGDIFTNYSHLWKGMPIPLRAIRANGEIEHDSSSLDDLLSLIQKAAERHFGQEGDRELIKQRSDASRAMDTLRASRTTGGAATNESWTAIKTFVESWSAYGKASWRYQARNRASRLWIGIFGDYCRISTNSLTE